MAAPSPQQYQHSLQTLFGLIVFYPTVADGRDICEIAGMDIDLTEATQRAIDEASRWGVDGSTSIIQAPAILLGLLTEPECRAAIQLIERGVNTDNIQAQWPTLQRLPSPECESLSPISNEGGSNEMVPLFSPETEAAIAIAAAWLADLPHPLVLATEHLLMGMAACEHEVGQWLRARNFDPITLRDEILERYGLATSSFELETSPPTRLHEPENDPTPPPPQRSSAAPPSPVSMAEKESTKHPSDLSVVRTLDASANRAREALRVIEDYVRFALDDRHLTEGLKTLRHRLTSALSKLEISDRLAMRETQSDVGTSISTEAELVRRSPQDVVTANFTRLQEALRSLEEFGKIGNSIDHQAVEQIRYATYTLQRALHSTNDAVTRLRGKQLYVLVDGRSSHDTFEKLVSSLVGGGVDILQLRDKKLGDRCLLERARQLRELTAGSETLFVMNDRPDLAALADADGVHVGQEELSLRDVRQIVGPRMLVGVSTHSLEQARQAVLDGANYIGVGPTFPSGTKAFTEFPGLPFAERVASEIRLPSFAIGGINADNIDKVLATGIRRVAVSGAVISAEAPAQAAKDLLDRLKVSP